MLSAERRQLTFTLPSDYNVTAMVATRGRRVSTNPPRGDSFSGSRGGSFSGSRGALSLVLLEAHFLAHLPMHILVLVFWVLLPVVYHPTIVSWVVRFNVRYVEGMDTRPLIVLIE